MTLATLVAFSAWPHALRYRGAIELSMYGCVWCAYGSETTLHERVEVAPQSLCVHVHLVSTWYDMLCPILR